MLRCGGRRSLWSEGEALLFRPLALGCRHSLWSEGGGEALLFHPLTFTPLFILFMGGSTADFKLTCNSWLSAWGEARLPPHRLGGLASGLPLSACILHGLGQLVVPGRGDGGGLRVRPFLNAPVVRGLLRVLGLRLGAVGVFIAFF